LFILKVNLNGAYTCVSGNAINDRLKMKNIDTLELGNKFSYRIDFRYKKFDNELQANYTSSSLTITVDEPVPEPMQRLWTRIIEEINPNYFKIEILDVKNIKE
jgi:hypothetical protein